MSSFHEALVGCGAITQGELGDLLSGAGFDDVRVAEQSMPTRFVMIGDAPPNGDRTLAR